MQIQITEQSEQEKRDDRNIKSKALYLDGDSGHDAMIFGDDEVISQNDDIALDFFRYTLCSGGRHI